jgi:hypothetical protein
MQGETVIVRAFRGRPRVLRIWETTPEAVFVCTEETYQRLASGEDEWLAIGVPREDVFCYDPSVVQELETSWQHDPSIWNRLTPWREDLCASNAKGVINTEQQMFSMGIAH